MKLRHVLSVFAACLSLIASGIALDRTVISPPHNQQANTVQTFNDGFATAKQDDCQQGFTVACSWIREVSK